MQPSTLSPSPAPPLGAQRGPGTSWHQVKEEGSGSQVSKPGESGTLYQRVLP